MKGAHPEPELTQHPTSFWEPLKFACLMGVCSRLVILLGLLVIAPALPVPEDGDPITNVWDTFSQWDGEHYEFIVEHGYRFRNDGKGYNVAFFPLFPLLIRGAMVLGLSVEVAGILINNLAFLGALVVLYRWVERNYGSHAARWATAALAWCPFSLFGTVVYSEGLFLLLSTLALQAFERKQYGWAALWGALTTATRPPGIALLPTFLLVAWRERRGAIAYLTACCTSIGLLLYMLFCWIRFQNPLAFVLTQRAWHPDKQAFHGAVWFDRLMEVMVGPANADAGKLVDPWYPLALLVVGGCAIALWQSRHRWGFPKTGYGVCGLVVILWLLGGSTLITLVMVFGGAYLLWYSRHQLTQTAVVYGLFSWIIILSTGRTISTERFAFAVVSLAIAFGLLLSRYPRWGYATLSFFAILLASLSVRFAQGLWAG